MPKRLTYSGVGVDIKKIRAAQKSIGSIIAPTHRVSGATVLSGFGHYAGLIKLGSKILAIHSDGVGTKVIVAQQANRFDTIGIDCVAMNVNDVICVGARPVAFVDYIALREPNDELIAEIMEGLVKGAKISKMAIVGGETAVVPDIISGASEDAFDLAGTVLGEVQSRRPLLGEWISSGDVILGVESSGLHSNGYTLARKILLSKYSIDDSAEFLVQTVGEELLVPTRIYVRPIMELFEKKTPVHGLANITGGSFAKLSRLNSSVDFVLDRLPQPHGIFKQIQVDGNIDPNEMYHTFNMGIGFCVICAPPHSDAVVRTFARHKMACNSIGRIVKGSGKVVANIDGKNVVL